MSGSDSREARSSGDGKAGTCKKLTSAPETPATRRAISLDWKRTSSSSIPPTAGTTRTPRRSGKRCAWATSQTVLPHEIASTSPGPAPGASSSASVGATSACSPSPDASAGTTAARRRSSASASSVASSAAGDGGRTSMRTIPCARASWRSRETVERETSRRSATSCCESSSS